MIVAHGASSMGIRQYVPLVLAYVLVSAAPVTAQVCLRPQPLTACKSTLITEFAVGTRVPSNGPTGRDQYFSGEFGWMANMAARSAVGGALHFGMDDEEDARIAFKPRYRHWLTESANLDVAAGLLLWGDDLQVPGFTGHAGVNYASIGGLGIQVEAFEDEVGRSTDWYLMGRLGAEWGLGGSVLAAVLGTIIYGIAGAAN